MATLREVFAKEELLSSFRAAIKARELGYKQVGAQLGVHPVTVAKWVTGKQGIHPLRVAAVEAWIAGEQD